MTRELTAFEIDTLRHAERMAGVEHSFDWGTDVSPEHFNRKPHSGQACKKVHVLNMLTGERHVFNSVAIASKFIGISYRVVYASCLSGSTVKGRYRCSYCEL